MMSYDVQWCMHAYDVNASMSTLKLSGQLKCVNVNWNKINLYLWIKVKIFLYFSSLESSI
jgi:hypothetical protein